MRFMLSVVLTLLLATASVAQGTVPLGNITITPPPPTSFLQQVTQPVDVTVTFNGLQYRVTGSLSGNLTFTVVSLTGGGTTGSTTISKVTDSSGVIATTGIAGGTIIVAGTGLGSFGTATVAGLPAAVKSWTTTAVTLTLPSVGAASGSATGPIILKPGDAAQAASTTAFTITGLSASLPPSGEPTWASPVIATSDSNERPGFLPIEPETVLAGPADDWLAPYLTEIVPAPDPLPEFKPTALVCAATAADGRMTISGQSFKEQGSGLVKVNEREVPVLSWTDEEIVVFFISLDLVTENASILVWHGLDDYYYGTVPLNGAPLG